MLWNTVYRTRHPVGRGRQAGGRRAAAFLSPLGWEHINLPAITSGGRAADWKTEVSALTDARKTLAYDFFRILRAPYLICARQNVKTAAPTSPASAAHEAGARTRATAHERTPQQERQKAARGRARP
ncbi:hypothetical protein ECZU34_61610 [Escherichia coli]|nr:hypothetical protein ECZU34_61610 [Escherichia coli]